VFDGVYASVLRHENLFFGEEDVVKTVSKAGEKWQFGIEKNGIEDYLKNGVSRSSRAWMPMYWNKGIFETGTAVLSER
jgi:hypothetical protein